MKQLTETAMRDTEAAAREISSVPSDKQDILARLLEAYKDGFLAGVGMNEKEPA